MLSPVPSGVSIRAALLISESHCSSSRAGVQDGKDHVSDTGITKGKISVYIINI